MVFVSVEHFVFLWEITIVVGVICSRWHKRCSLWDKLMCSSSNIGKEWVA